MKLLLSTSFWLAVMATWGGIGLGQQGHQLWVAGGGGSDQHGQQGGVGGVATWRMAEGRGGR